MPSVQMLSFIAIGTPASVPSFSPFFIFSSISFAFAKALSVQRVR